MLEGYAYCRMVYEGGRPVDFVHLEVNPAFERLTGLTGVVGRRATELVPGLRDSPELLQSFGRVVETGVPERFESYLAALDVWFRLSVFRPEAGCFVAVFENVSATKLAEAALRESQRFAQAVLDGLASHIAVVDEDGRIVAVNEAWWQFAAANGAGRGGPCCEGANYLEVCSHAAANGDREAERFAVGLRAVLDGAADRYEQVYPCHSPGEQRWFQARVTLFAEGGPRRAVIAHENITPQVLSEHALRESMARYEALVESSPDAIFVDRGGVIAMVNPACVELLGAARSEDLVGRSPLEFIHPEDHALVRDRIRALVASGSHAPRAEVRFLRSDGAVVFVESVATRLGEDAESAIQVILRDVTERHRLEAEMRRQQELLRDAGEIAHLGGWEFDPATGEGTWTDETRRIFDIGPEVPATLAQGLAYFHGESRRRIEAALATASAGDAPYDLELELVSAKGVAKWARMIGHPELRQGRVVRVRGSIQDVTERKRAEEELRRSEERLRLALEAANQGLWDYDVERARESVSPEYASMLGYDPVAFHESDAAWIERLHPEDRERVLTAYRDCLDGRVAEYRTEYRERAAGGDWKWILSLGRVVERDAAGRPLRMLGTRTDITERKRADERVRASEARLRLALEAASQGLWDLDVATGETAVSPEYASMLGYDPADFHETDAAWMERLHPDDAEQITGIYRDYLAGRLSDYRVEFRQRTASGAWKWILSLGRAVERDPEGRPLRMVGTHTDITERKAAEEALAAERSRLRALLDTLPDPVWLKDPEGVFLASNPAFARLTGVSVEDLVGHTDYDYFPRELADAFRARDRIAISAGRPMVNEEWVTHPTDGRAALLETTKTPMRNHRGELIGVLGIARDVTEARQTAEALRQSEERLRLFIEHAPAALAMFDREMRYLAASRRWRTDFGLEDQELTGRCHYEVFPEIGEELREVHRRGLAGEVIRAEQERFDRADGSTQWLRWEVRPWHDSSGATAGILIFSEDITARELAMSALAESEAHYRALAETTFDWIWEVDPSARYTFVSPRVTELLGYTPEEVLGRTPFDLMSEVEAARVAAAFGAAAARREPFAALENVNRHRDGRLIVLESSGVPFFGPAGEFRGYRGMDRDITARKQAERRLATQVTISRALAGSDTLAGAARQVLAAIGSSEGWAFGTFWAVDREREVLRCLELWRREGLAAQNLERQSRDLELAKGEGLAGRVWASRSPEIVTSAALGPSFLRREAALDAGLEGAVAFPIVAGEEVLGVVDFVAERLHEADPSLLEMFEAVGRQLGQFLERRRAEEAVERFVSGSPAVIYALRVRPDGLKLAWHGGNLEALTGWPVEAIRADGWWVDNIHPEDRERVLAANALPDEADHQVLEFRFRRPDGSYVWVRDEKRLLHDAAGQLTEVVGSWTDVTERVRLEEQLRSAQKLEAIGRLAGGVAHDFNNLLTVITGNGELLARALEPEGPEQVMLSEIRDAGDRAAALTRQLLAFSRNQVLTPQLLELNAVVEKTEGMLRRLIGEDIELTCRLAPDTGWVRVDPGQLEQVIVNLAINARDAMPRGGQLLLATRFAELDVAFCRGRPELEPGRYAMLEVRDTGTGMSPEVLQRLFEPFFTTKGPGSGTGLGLATVHGVVAQSGGRIEVESEPGRGSCFTIFLPAAAAPALAVEAVAAPPPARGHETILLVEDEDGVRRIARIALEGRGYRVLAAASGRAAIGVAEGHGPRIDLLVTDLVMPGMSGRELADELRVRRPGLRVLFISGYVEDELARHGIVEAEVAFLHKPFSLDELGAKVRAVLDGELRTATPESTLT